MAPSTGRRTQPRQPAQPIRRVQGHPLQPLVVGSGPAPVSGAGGLSQPHPHPEAVHGRPRRGVVTGTTVRRRRNRQMPRSDELGAQAGAQADLLVKLAGQGLLGPLGGLDLAAGKLELTGVLGRVGPGRAQQRRRVPQVIQDRGRHDEAGGLHRIGAAHQGFPPPPLPPGASVAPALPLLRSLRRLARSSTGVGVGRTLGELDDDGSELGLLLGCDDGSELGSLLGCDDGSELGLLLGCDDGSELGSLLGVAEGGGL